MSAVKFIFGNAPSTSPLIFLHSQQVDMSWMGDSIISRFVIITVANGSSHKQFKVRVGDLDELRGRLEDGRRG